MNLTPKDLADALAACAAKAIQRVVTTGGPAVTSTGGRVSAGGPEIPVLVVAVVGDPLVADVVAAIRALHAKREGLLVERGAVPPP